MIEQKSKPLRIVALNTNLWLESPTRGGYYAWEPRRSREGVAGVVREPWDMGASRVHDEDPAGQWRWLDDELLKARNARKTVSTPEALTGSRRCGPKGEPKGRRAGRHLLAAGRTSHFDLRGRSWAAAGSGRRRGRPRPRGGRGKKKEVVRAAGG